MLLLESLMKKYGYYNHYNKPLNELSIDGESIDDIDDDNFELEDPDNEGGDEETFIAIQEEYKKLKSEMEG